MRAPAVESTSSFTAEAGIGFSVTGSVITGSGLNGDGISEVQFGGRSAVSNVVVPTAVFPSRWIREPGPHRFNPSYENIFRALCSYGQDVTNKQAL